MLAPTDRRLLLDVLAPPEGYRLDQALGTTYTLDLLALLRIPLAATALPWSASNGGPVDNPFALLTALRRNASRVSLYCHAGATKVPARHVPLLAFLEDAVHPVSPPRLGGVFHPKVWVLRFVPDYEEDPIAYRLVVLSRNLTFDRSWDIALTLDGDLIDRKRGYSRNRPLAEFIGALPAMAERAGTQLTDAAVNRADLIAAEIRRVDWWLPEGFYELAFHPIGHDGRPSWPISDLRRLLVLSPFIGAPALSALRDDVAEDLQVISRFEELARVDADILDDIDDVHIFDDAATLLDVDDATPDVEDADTSRDPSPELCGLHAKVFVGKRSRQAVVYIGSANATEAAFERNVEFLVELEGSHAEHGIDRTRETLEHARLLAPFVPGAPDEIDEAGEALERELERAAHALACGGIRAAADTAGDGRWRVQLYADDVDLGELQLEARPLSIPTLRPVDLDASPACSFPPVSLPAVTRFFALRLGGRTASGPQQLDVTVRLALDGAPDGRVEAVTAELLSDRERLLRFILILLSDDAHADRMLDELADLLAESHVGATSSVAPAAALGLPLLEPLLRTLHRDPDRLDEVDRLFADIRSAGGATEDLLPAELEELWETLAEVRRRQS